MRAGEAIDQALKLSGKAGGLLCYMWVKERVSRSLLEQAAQDLEEAAAAIRSVLPAREPCGYSEASPGEDHHDKD